MEKRRVFVDSSVLIAAVLSSRGGSFYILTHLQDICTFSINEYVLAETVRVLDAKFTSMPGLKSKLFLMIGAHSIQVLPNATIREVRTCARVIEKEDAPILASAIKHAGYLLTLDNDFFGEKVTQFVRRNGLLICKPREFIEMFRLNDTNDDAHS